MLKLIVTNQPELTELEIPGVEIIRPKQYFSQERYSKLKNIKVFNLCTDLSYQSKGYYVSLLAEARGHKPIPDVKNVQDLKHTAVIRTLTDDLNSLIQKQLSKLKSDQFELSVYFGRNIARQYDKLSSELHRIFPMPLFRVKFVYTDRWLVQSIKTIALKDVPDYHISFLKSAAHDYFDRSRYRVQRNETMPFDLAILVQRDETSPPSNERALVKFKQVAEKHGFYTEFVQREDVGRLNEFDALFIRTTTSVNHYSYRWARKAESQGLAVIDDPSSILKCANKVYLAELLRNNDVDTPKTMIIHSDNKKDIVSELGLPCILKLPDSSFSQGVVKVKTAEELEQQLKRMFERSELLIGQAYLPTDYDWRIGIIEGEVFFACKYYMARGHWQIYNWSSSNKKNVEGGFETVPVQDVPAHVLQTALKSASLIGRGLYGVDLKEVDGHAVVIEVNDNPNIDFGVEDRLDKDLIYEKVVLSLKKRVQDRIGIKF
jgi:glutathione synthase/RimK-type ligase-like ATP-grasp enzyme